MTATRQRRDAAAFVTVDRQPLRRMSLDTLAELRNLQWTKATGEMPGKCCA